jgi:small subunit ribosomal protein S6
MTKKDDARTRPREYETIYILRPDIDSDGAEKVAKRVVEVIDRLKGTLLKVDSWGRRKLEYPVHKHRKGIYVLLRYLGFADMVTELERNLRMMDAVVKHQTVLLEKDVDPASRTVVAEQITFAPIEAEKEDEQIDESKITYRDADDYVSGKPTIVGEGEDWDRGSEEKGGPAPEPEA